MSLTAPNILKAMNPSPGGFANSSSALGAKVKVTPQSAFTQAMQRQSQLTLAGAKAVGEGEFKRHAQAEKAAGDLISNALILPMLKQLRRSPWGENTVFSRGIGEKTFGPQFDIQISDRIAHSPRLGLKTALTERLIKRGQTDAASSSDNLSSPASRLDTHG